MIEQFQHIRFKSETKMMILLANDIIEDTIDKGYKLTLRQLYYRIVAKDLFPDDRLWTWNGSKWVRDPQGTKNAQPNYKWLGTIINDARLAGMIDWDSIEDRTRNIESESHWRSPAHIIRDSAMSMRIDKWENQPFRVEVWVEKDALVGVLEKACRELDVSWFSCRGYTSQTALYDAGKRLKGHFEAGQKPIVIHLGDHDPSGLDMTRDIRERLEMFVGEPVDMHRIALNWNQVQEYSPPPNWAKETDTRFAKYQEEFGDESWELDALDVEIIHDLIKDKVLEFRDEDIWDEDFSKEERMREELDQTRERWNEVVGLLQTKPGEMSKFFESQRRQNKRKKKP